jgi:3-hydroxyisobutyrate dehydrogenase-like beta-hydroxyacid dehydrogenase
VLEILKTGAAFSRVMEFKQELLTSRDFSGKLQLTTELFTKDLRFALEAGQELGVPLPHAVILLQDLICANLRGEQRDYSCLLEVLESRAGL